MSPSKSVTRTWRKGEPAYPPQLAACLGGAAPAAVTLVGPDRQKPGSATESGVPLSPSLALFCSAQAPAGILLAVHDLAQQWRQGNNTIISGFHSPAEKEAFHVLLRGPAPIIHCPARSLAKMRLDWPHKMAIGAGHLWLLSPFPDTIRRATKETAHFRNRFAAALADAVLIAYAHPGGKTEQLAQEVIAWGKPAYTIDHPANENLLALGATPLAKEEDSL